MASTAILNLQSAGFSNEQVEALLAIFDDRAVTKDDLDLTDHKIDKLDRKIERLMLESKIEIIKWVIGMNMAMVGLLVALLKFV